MHMARSTELREREIAPPHPHEDNRGKFAYWPKLKLVMTRAVFWSYERGSWQYDVIVVVILAFIFITPASWFHDRPRLQLTDLRHVQGIVEVSHDRHDWVFQIDARLLNSLESLTPKDAVQQLLRQRVQTPFVIKSLQPILDKNGVVLGYTVDVSPR